MRRPFSSRLSRVTTGRRDSDSRSTSAGPVTDWAARDVANANTAAIPQAILISALCVTRRPARTKVASKSGHTNHIHEGHDLTGANLFVAALENEGVERIFGVAGEENLAFVESLRQSSIELIVTRHEQSAAFMAATYGRLTGKP